MLMGANDRTIDTVLLPIDLADSVSLLLQGFQDSLPDAGFDPPVKSARDRTPRAIAFGQISPRRTRSQNPQDTIENQAMILRWTTHLWLLRR
jgi:hypothetical protein